MQAIMADEDECARVLATQECDVVDGEGNTALHIAAEYGNSYAVKLLKPLLLNKRNNNGETAFIRACRTAQMHCLVDLVEEADQTDARGRTPLMHAVASNNLELVEILFEKYQNRLDDDGLSATAHAFALDAPAVGAWLLEREELN